MAKVASPYTGGWSLLAREDDWRSTSKPGKGIMLKRQMLETNKDYWATNGVTVRVTCSQIAACAHDLSLKTKVPI